MTKCPHKREDCEYGAQFDMGGMVMVRDFMRCKCGAEYSIEYHRWTEPPRSSVTPTEND